MKGKGIEEKQKVGTGYYNCQTQINVGVFIYRNAETEVKTEIENNVS